MTYCVDCGKKHGRHPQAIRCANCMFKASESRGGSKTAFSGPAQQMVKQAVRMGYLPKLDGSIRCTDCPAPADRYDHRDYWNPLDVQPVCRIHNMRRGPALSHPVMTIIAVKRTTTRARRSAADRAARDEALKIAKRAAFLRAHPEYRASK